MKDPIVEEVREARDAHARTFNYDLKTIFADIRRQQQESKRQYVSFPAQRLVPISEEPNRISEGSYIFHRFINGYRKSFGGAKVL